MSAHVSDVLAYRSTLQVNGGDEFFPAVRRVARKWLDVKYNNAPLESGLHQLSATSTLMSQILYEESGQEKALRFQLRDDAASATFLTTITAVVGEHYKR